MSTQENSIIIGIVNIGKGSKIWNFCNIYGTEEDPISIGENTQIGSYCEIKPGVKIGNNCRIQSYVFLSEGTQIGNDVFIGPKSSFLNDKYPTTSKAIKKNWEKNPSIIKDGVSIGGNVTILPGTVIEEDSIIGAGSVVTKNIKRKSIVFGNPAKSRN